MTIISQIKNIIFKQKASYSVGIVVGSKSLSLFARTEDKIYSEEIELHGRPIGELIKNKLDEYAFEGALHIVLTNDKSKIIQVERPNVPEEEINSALKWQIKDLVNVPPEKMLLDYFDGPTFAGVKKVNVVCVSKSEVSDLVNDLFSYDLKVVAITTEEFAFASLLPIENHATLMVCQQPGEEINLLIVKEGQVFFTRRLRGFSTIDTQSQNELMLGVIDSLSLEIQRSTDYFERQLKQAPIKNIQVLLPIENEAFIAEKLAENTNVDVQLLSMPDYALNYRNNAVVVGSTQLNFLELGNNG